MANAIVRIISIDNLCKKLGLTYNFNISNLRVHILVIITILQGIVISIKYCFILPLLYEVSNQFISLVSSKLPIHKVLNWFTLSALSRLPIYEAPDQLILSALSRPSTYKTSDQSILSMLLRWSIYELLLRPSIYEASD